MLICRSLITLSLLVCLQLWGPETHAQIIAARGTGLCESPHRQISLRELQGLLESSPSAEDCDVYQTLYVENLQTLGWTSEEGFDGPWLFVKVIQNDLKSFAFKTDIITIRGDVPLCLERQNDRETLTYRSEHSQGEGFMDYLFNMKTVTRRLYLEFTAGTLNKIDHEVTDSTGGVLNNNRERLLFQCGAFSPVLKP